jgi:hypothetical protein
MRPREMQHIAKLESRKLLVGMSEDDGVDPGDFGRDLAYHILLRVPIQPSMRGDDHDIGMLALANVPDSPAYRLQAWLETITVIVLF